jgi:hypothetical protein
VGSSSPAEATSGPPPRPPTSSPPDGCRFSTPSAGLIVPTPTGSGGSPPGTKNQDQAHGRGGHRQLARQRQTFWAPFLFLLRPLGCATWMVHLYGSPLITHMAFSSNAEICLGATSINIAIKRGSSGVRIIGSKPSNLRHSQRFGMPCRSAKRTSPSSLVSVNGRKRASRVPAVSLERGCSYPRRPWYASDLETQATWCMGPLRHTAVQVIGDLSGGPFKSRPCGRVEAD